MSAFPKFDPWAGVANCEGGAAKVAKVAKVREPSGRKPESLPTLAGQRPRLGPSDPLDSEPGDARACAGTLKICFGSEAKGIPAEWTEGVNKLLKLPCSLRVPLTRWQTLQSDAARFIETWGVQAARLGWGTLDLFGTNATKPFERLDAAGLVWLLNGRPVVALTASEAVVQCSTARQTYRRKPPGLVTAKSCLLWELGGGER